MFTTKAASDGSALGCECLSHGHRERCECSEGDEQRPVSHKMGGIS